MSSHEMLLETAEGLVELETMARRGGSAVEMFRLAHALKWGLVALDHQDAAATLNKIERFCVVAPHGVPVSLADWRCEALRRLSRAVLDLCHRRTSQLPQSVGTSDGDTETGVMPTAEPSVNV